MNSNSIFQMIGGPPETAQIVSVHQSSQQIQRRAMSLALSGRSQGGSRQLDGFLAFADEHELTLDQLWVARKGQRDLACLIMKCPGRTSALYLSPVLGNEDVPLARQLVLDARRGSDIEAVTFIQAAVEPHQAHSVQALTGADFEPLAQLTYMTLNLTAAPESNGLPAEMELACWSDQVRKLFKRAILSSYKATQDCPRLVGLRHIDDVIAGHMACRQFIAPLWIVMSYQGVPAGVMLMNQSSSPRAGELVYLGLSPQWRGRGLARPLMRYGFALAYAQGIRSISLAVDQQNEPAVCLYRSFGFEAYARKHALIHVHK